MEKVSLKSAFDKVKETGQKFSEEASKAYEASKPLVEKAGKTISEKAGQAKEAAKPVLAKAGETAVIAKDKSVELALKGKDEIFKVLDQNGNGDIDIEVIIILGLKTPGVRIDRKNFLKKEFMKLYKEEDINKAIETTPARAGFKKEDIDYVADEVIKAERVTVSGISAALGAPGGVAVLATIPTDIAQYYGSMLKVMQKLLYLYGFPQINLEEKGQILDSATLNTLTLCLGVMYGVAGANNALKAMAKALATGVEKKLINTALTKGTIYPIVKEVAKWFGKKMTKEVFAGFFKGAIPVIGSVIGGSLTFFSFKPCCDHLKTELQDTLLSNPDHVEVYEEDIIDVEVNKVE